MRFNASDGISLYHETYGDPTDTPVMLIHGIGADHNMWKPQITSFPDAGYFIIVPDLRGHGESDIPSEFRIADCARDLLELSHPLNLPRFHLIGVSMGGMVAQRFVAQYPGHAETQVIVDSLSGVSRPIERFNASLAAALLKVLPPKLQANMVRNSYKKLGQGDVGQYFEERIMSMDSHWLLAARQEVNRFNILEDLPAMNIPTLVLVGDAFGNLAIDMARTTAENIPRADMRILKGGGDPSNLLVPEAFDKEVFSFLEKHSQTQ